MTVDIAALKESVARKIDAAYRAQGFAANVYAHPTIDPPTPCVLLTTGEVEYHITYSETGVAEMALGIEVRIPTGGTREVDALKECDAVLGVGTIGSLFDAVSADNYALDVPGWAFVIVAGGPPRWAFQQDGQRQWYSINFTARLATRKG